MLLVAFANDDLPSGYYRFLRIECFILFLILSALESRKQRYIAAIIFGSCSILFNPFYLVTFPKGIWQNIDGSISLLVICWIVVEAILLLVKTKKRKKVMNIGIDDKNKLHGENEKKITVVHCDDHSLFRNGVKVALKRKADIQFAGEAANGLELLHLLEKVMPDIVILNVAMPVMDGIQTLPEIKKRYPNLKVIMLTMHNSPDIIAKVMMLGANAYLTKNADSEEIYAAIKCVKQFNYYYNDALGSVIGASSKPNGNANLSPRESEILNLLKENKTEEEIARLSNIEERTVFAIIDNIIRKTGVKDRSELLRAQLK